MKRQKRLGWHGGGREYLQREVAGSDDLAVRITKKYEKKYSVKHVYDRQSKFIIQFLKSYQVVRLLDLGCGMGNFLVKAQDSFPHICGVDPAPQSLEIARRLLPMADLRIGQGEQLPFASNYFDAIVMKGVVHHLKDPVIVFCEVNRCLKPGGVVVIFEGDCSSIYRTVILGIADLLKIYHESTLFKHRLPKIMRQMLTKAGIRPFSSYKISGLFTPLALSAVGGAKMWNILDTIEDILQKKCPFVFNYHIMMAARKNKGVKRTKGSGLHS